MNKEANAHGMLKTSAAGNATMKATLLGLVCLMGVFVAFMPRTWCYRLLHTSESLYSFAVVEPVELVG